MILNFWWQIPINPLFSPGNPHLKPAWQIFDQVSARRHQARSVFRPCRGTLGFTQVSMKAGRTHMQSCGDVIQHTRGITWVCLIRSMYPYDAATLGMATIEFNGGRSGIAMKGELSPWPKLPQLLHTSLHSLVGKLLRIKLWWMGWQMLTVLYSNC